MIADTHGGESGFTLIEVLVATGVFVFVAFAGFEMVRQIGAGVFVLAQRADAAAHLAAVEGALRSEAISATSVFTPPPSGCGAAAVEMLERDAGGTSFIVYTTKTQNGVTNVVRATGPGPLDPCDDSLAFDTVLTNVNAALSVTSVSAAALPAHADPIGGANDGGILKAAGITDVRVDSHDRDFDGSAIQTGNGVVELQLDVDPAVAVIDLVAGNRPSGYTQQLAYVCGGRCEATTPFAEIRDATYTGCAQSWNWGDSPAYYVPAAYAYQTLPTGQRKIVVTAYDVVGQYVFSFAGPAPLVVARTWGPAVWPPAGSALAGTIADAYPMDYTNNAVRTRGVAGVAADVGAPVTYAAELGACSRFAEGGILFQ